MGMHGGFGGGGMGMRAGGFGGARFAGGPGFGGGRFAHGGFGPRFAGGRNAFFRHDHFRRFAFFGAPYYYDSYYNDGCWSRYWTAYGWQTVNVCGDYW